MSRITIQVYHGGRFVQNHELEYVGGKISHFDECDTDKLNIMEFHSMVRELGYRQWHAIWYMVPGTEFLRIGLRRLETDGDVLNFIAESVTSNVLDVYVEEGLPTTVLPPTTIYIDDSD